MKKFQQWLKQQGILNFRPVVYARWITHIFAKFRCFYRREYSKCKYCKN